jgi:tellurite methyltransferase
MPDNSLPPSDDRWPEYYDAMAGKPPRDTLLFALDRFDAEEPGVDAECCAIDLGCGEGRDTVEMLRRGWRVLAVDAQEEAIRRVRARPDLPPGSEKRLQTLVSPMEAARLPAALLVNASFALPFCPPEAFPALWDRITESPADSFLAFAIAGPLSLRRASSSTPVPKSKRCCAPLSLNI